MLLHESTYETYMKIYNSRDKGEKEEKSPSIKNAKMIKRYFLNYLKQRYSNRLA